MAKEEYPQLQETLLHEKLDNGLDVFILPKPGFTKAYATFATSYGSVDNRFKRAGHDEVRVPDGIAHFLEHKMFEEPEGDIFSTFASQGASANAFTSFDRTVYLFSATESIEKNVETLLDFVQNPYFTDENVEKEKGIIVQEINMYRDNADWRVYFGLIEALYTKHPVHIDIAGTPESVRSITKEMLYECYNTFYHPSNMSLFLVGGVDAEAMMERIKANQSRKTFGPGGEIERFFDEEPETVRTPRLETKLPVSLPKCMFGYKEIPGPQRGEEAIRRELASKLMLESLLGASSPLYQELYDDNLISDGFGYEYNTGPGYSFSVIGGETRDPDELIKRVTEALGQAAESGIDERIFERTRRKRIGSYLRMLNSPEAIAGEFTRYRSRGGDLFKLVEAYESLTIGELNARLREHVNPSRMSASIVRGD
ncbi:EF-P 5-aminopentanol modification-associated protein YfmH [Cohnella thailandensis]|uniref:Insulinase family protein n=1 Tax=Cohnella thailandensis TaxID=557557 RepID=A0A841SYM2_9BACL|nr:pitrilysin family protein [Cohnella thailandensis]MBB6635325.1 insulinase family protein [Cohnella thailandensis]MBP1974704.1 putative Zn-dependent peptidase [Cohnella thailandensis]